jgi:hypothetical protein
LRNYGALEHFDGGSKVELVEAHRTVDGAQVELEGERMARGQRTWRSRASSLRNRAIECSLAEGQAVRTVMAAGSIS